MDDTPNVSTQYNSLYTGPQIDDAVGAVLTKEAAWDAGAAGKMPAGGSAGQIIQKTASADNAAAWTTPPFLVRPNLLDNWYFGAGVINQRGSYSPSGGEYSIDRWKAGANALTVTPANDGLEIAAADTTAENWTIKQVISRPYASLAGRQVTYTILYADASVIKLATGTGVIPSPAEDSTVIGLSEENVPGGYLFQLITSAAGTITAQIGWQSNTQGKIIAAKLEIGDSQTLARWDGTKWVLNELPDPGIELAKCKKYFQILTHAGASGQLGYVIANVMAYDTSSVNLTLRLGMTPAASNAVTITKSSISEAGDLMLATGRIVDGIPVTGFANNRVTDRGDVIVSVKAEAGSLTVGAVYNLALRANRSWVAFSTEP